MKNTVIIFTILKILLMISFFVFALALTFYALSALSLPKAKNENTVQIIIAFTQCFILPILFYITGTVSLFSNKSWVWGFIIIGGIFIVLLNLPNVALRFIHIGIYILVLLTYLLKKLS